jgi:hypothetical protein
MDKYRVIGSVSIEIWEFNAVYMGIYYRVIGPEEPFVCTIHFSGRIWYAQQAIGK